jgi:hypothetical protein
MIKKQAIAGITSLTAGLHIHPPVGLNHRSLKGSRENVDGYLSIFPLIAYNRDKEFESPGV